MLPVLFVSPNNVLTYSIQLILCLQYFVFSLPCPSSPSSPSSATVQWGHQQTVHHSDFFLCFKQNLFSQTLKGLKIIYEYFVLCFADGRIFDYIIFSNTYTIHVHWFQSYTKLLQHFCYSLLLIAIQIRIVKRLNTLQIKLMAQLIFWVYPFKRWV